MNDTQTTRTEPVLVATPVEAIERRPRAVHYWWWAVCVGFCSVDSYFQLQDISAIVRPYWLLLTTVALTTVSSSMLLFGLGLFAVRRMRRIKYPQYEGECLLLAAGVHIAAYIVLHSLPTIFAGREASFLVGRPHQAIAIVVPILSVLAMMVGWRRAGKAWRVFIVMYSSMMLLLCLDNQSFAASFEFLSLPLDKLSFLYLIGLVWMDITKKRQLPWTHWLGIAAYLWQESSSGGFQSYHWILQQFQSVWPF